MKPPYITTQFLVTEHQGELEVWVDWVPGVDGDGRGDLQARLEGSALVVEPIGTGAELRAARRVQGLDPGVIDGLRGGFTWYVSGPSGVLGRHRLKPG